MFGFRICSPAGAQLGLIELIVGTELVPMLIVKVIAFEVPPPAPGLVTDTVSVPLEAMEAAGMAAVNCVEFTNVVAGAAPPKLTIEPATKFVPLKVSVKAAPPAKAEFGTIAFTVGAVGVLLDPAGKAVDAADPQP